VRAGIIGFFLNLERVLSQQFRGIGPSSSLEQPGEISSQSLNKDSKGFLLALTTSGHSLTSGSGNERL
jgi:hypothetical protein